MLATGSSELMESRIHRIQIMPIVDGRVEMGSSSRHETPETLHQIAPYAQGANLRLRALMRRTKMVPFLTAQAGPNRGKGVGWTLGAAEPNRIAVWAPAQVKAPAGPVGVHLSRPYLDRWLCLCLRGL